MIVAGGRSLPGAEVHPVTSGAPHPTADACCSRVVRLVIYGNSGPGPWRLLQITFWTPAILEATSQLTPALQSSEQLWEDWPEHPPCRGLPVGVGVFTLTHSCAFCRPLSPEPASVYIVWREYSPLSLELDFESVQYLYLHGAHAVCRPILRAPAFPCFLKGVYVQIYFMPFYYKSCTQ